MVDEDSDYITRKLRQIVHVSSQTLIENDTTRLTLYVIVPLSILLYSFPPVNISYELIQFETHVEKKYYLYRRSESLSKVQMILMHSAPSSQKPPSCKYNELTTWPRHLFGFYLTITAFTQNFEKSAWSQLWLDSNFFQHIGYLSLQY